MRKTIVILAVLMFAAAASAEVGLQLTTGKAQYSKGDTVTVTAIITNTGGTGESVRLTYNVKSDNAAAESGPAMMPVTVGAGQEKQVIVYSKAADEMMDGRYTVTAGIYSPAGLIANREAQFTVAGVLRNPVYTIKICKDEACTQELSYMLVGQPAWIRVESADNIASTVSITNPDGVSSALSPPATYKPSKAGTYKVVVKVQGAGLKTAEETRMIPAVASEPSLTASQNCNENGKCESGENPTNCPQDCVQTTKPKEQEKPGETPSCIPLLLAPFSLLIALSAAFLRP